MTPLAATPAPELSITAVPAKPKRTPRVKVPAVTPVTVADIPPAAKPAKAAKKPIESPAPVEAIAPAAQEAGAKPPPSRRQACCHQGRRPESACESSDGSQGTGGQGRRDEARVRPQSQAQGDRACR